MTKMIFVNLPVTDLKRSIQFYEALGFKQNKEFSDDSGAGMVWDENIWVMLLTRDFYQKFLKNQTTADTHETSGSMTAFSLPSVEDVKKFAQTAEANGGESYHIDIGMPEDQMYELDVKDPDGNVLSAVWMAM